MLRLRQLWTALRRLAGAPLDSATPSPPGEPRRDRGAALAASGLIEDAESSVKSVEELQALENAGIPSIGRQTDAHEALADERQDPTTSLNFPWHWTSAVQSWQYLFDFGVACDLLSPRPDDLVLDLAAGTCWATELLCRLGVRTVSIDLSVEMMRRGRQRLAADERLVFRSDAAFVVARGQALPFASGTFDGVVCMNALHHMPSYAETLREVHRILKPGGRAVFSEPGTAHSEQELSKFRMHEETIVEKSVSLPLIRRFALAAGFARMTIVPLRSAVAYAMDYTATPEDGERLDQLWNDTLRLGPREHARFVLHKGDDPPLDTLLPADRLVGRLRAEMVVEAAVATAASGEPFTDLVRVTNAGTVTWRARGRRFGGQVTCGVQVCDLAGAVIRDDLGRTPLPHDVAPGESVSLDLVIAGALPAGRYVRRYDMVVEGVTWFAHQGSPTVTRLLEIGS